MKRTKPDRSRDVSGLVLSMLESPVYTWLLLSCPYSRPTGISIMRKETREAAVELERLGLLEREPTAAVAIYRCTEKGEEIAHALLTFFGTQRV